MLLGSTGYCGGVVVLVGVRGVSGWFIGYFGSIVVVWGIASFTGS